MSLGLSKTERYVLPLFPALEVLAGLGWYSFIELLEDVWDVKARKSLGLWVGASTLILILQAGFSLPYSPYYLSYYNPLIGDGQQVARRQKRRPRVAGRLDHFHSGQGRKLLRQFGPTRGREHLPLGGGVLGDYEVDSRAFRAGAAQLASGIRRSSRHDADYLDVSLP